MENLYIEFETNKIIKIGNQRGFDFEKVNNLSLPTLPTFKVFDEYMDGYLVATIQWTGESWACIPQTESDVSTCAIGAMFNEAKSPYFWEISPGSW